MKTKEYLQEQVAKRNDELGALLEAVAELEKINEESQDEAELTKAGEELDALKEKKAELETELKQLEDAIAELEQPVEPVENGERAKTIINIMNRGANNMNNEEKEVRAKEFKDTGKNVINLRATTISGGTVVTPVGVNGINDAYNSVSSIVDLVKVENCEGMGSNKVAYVSVLPTADGQTEGSAITNSDPTFAFVTLTPDSYGIISYITNQVKKQSPLDYQGKIEKLAMDSLKVKMANVITNAVKASALATTVNATVASSKGKIDEKTLRNLVLSYGGSEGVEGQAWLFLNKADLIAFGDVRGTNDKKAVYEIEPNAENPNVGIIKDGGLAVRYCINSNCVACHDTVQTTTAIKTMFYGNPANIELDLFSNYDIAVSEDFKFAENMLAIRGTVDADADVVHKDGVVFLQIPATI